MDSELIVDVVKKVFPAGTEIHLDGRAGPAETRLWMIPGKGREPRWILPHQPRYACPFLRQWSPYDLRSRFKWLCLMTAYRSGQLGCVSGIIPLRVVTSESENWNHLGWFATSPPVPVIYIGTMGPTRKVVAGLVDTDERRVLSVAKAPISPQARHAIIHEADVLVRLEKEKPGIAPRLLFVNRETGIATQDIIEGRPSARNLTLAHIDWLLNLAVPGEIISLREYARNLAEQIVELDGVDKATRDVLAGVTSGIDAHSTLPAVWVHGDFAPWNLKLRQDGKIAAVDWEHAVPNGLPLFDLVYFGSIQAFLFGEKRIVAASMEPLLRRYLDRLGIDPGIFRTLFFTCLAEDWLRSHKEGNLRRASFLFRHLCRETGNLG